MTYSTEDMRDAEWDQEREPELQPSDIADMHATEAALFLREHHYPNAPVGELREIYDALPEDAQRRSNAWREIARIWEARQRGKGSERPVVDASYMIRTPEGRTVEVIVTDITEDEVGFRLLDVRHGVSFRCPVDDFMGMTL